MKLIQRAAASLGSDQTRGFYRDDADLIEQEGYGRTRARWTSCWRLRLLEPVLFSASPWPYTLLGLPPGASIWSGGMGHNHLTALCGRLGLVAAFVLITTIIAAPLLQRVWSPEVVIAQR